MTRTCSAIVVVLAVALVPAVAGAQDASPDWMRGLDELMAMQVTTVARKEQRLVDTAAAVYVLTKEEIRRSGLRTVPDLLRLVPGLHVAQQDGNKWAVSARGMNGRFANKLLVMIDGRSIYTPYFAGVFWDSIDVAVEDIDRIEVIRGPGASMWGANAVNGVINIITGSSPVRRETRVTAGVGNTDFASVAHQDRLADRFGYKVTASVNGHDALRLANGASAGDEWRDRTAGAQFDVTFLNGDRLEASARAMASRPTYLASYVTSLAPFTSETSTLTALSDTWMARLGWTRELRRGGELSIEAFTDGWTRRDEAFDHRRRTTDVTLQHQLGQLGRHNVQWGAGTRITAERTAAAGLFAALQQEDYDHHILNVFAQDDVTIGRAQVVVGTKVAHQDSIGWHIQPTARVHWTLSPTAGAWAAVSRALRAPDRLERGVRMNLFGLEAPGRLPIVFTLEGNSDAEAERLLAYEVGYRTSAGPAVSVDVAAYYNKYDGLQTLVAAAEPTLDFDAGRPYLRWPSSYANLFEARTAGGEVTATVAPTLRWKLTGSYTLFSYKGRFVPPAVDINGADGGAAPRHQGQLRYSVNLPGAIEADAMLFATAGLPAPFYTVPAHARLDARLGWRPVAPLQLSLTLQNLTDGTQPEFVNVQAINPSVVPRSAALSVSWHF
jgi:iron complex outermembrane recepter protein